MGERWTAEDNWIRCDNDPKRGIVARSPDEDNHPLSFEAWSARKHLIAAAPALLEACEALDAFQRLYEIKTWGDKMPGNELYSGKLMAIVGQARAAIARAKGE